MRLKLRRISTLLGAENIRSSNCGKTGCGELGHSHIVAPTGTVTDQQLSRCVSAHDHANVAVVGIKSQIPRLGLALRDIGAVSMLRTGAAAVAYDITQAVVEGPIHKPGAVKAEGTVGPGG